jgi:hypothetical protein
MCGKRTTRIALIRREIVQVAHSLPRDLSRSSSSFFLCPECDSQNECHWRMRPLLLNPDRRRNQPCGIEWLPAVGEDFSLLVCGMIPYCLYRENTKGGEYMKIKVNVRASGGLKAR